MKNLWLKIDGFKTYGISIATVLYAVLYYGVGQHDWATAFSLIFGASGISALRHGVAKVE